MLRTPPQCIAWAFSLWLVCLTAHAELDGLDMYVYVEISVREATVEGMRQRLALLKRSDYSKDADNAIDAQTRVRVSNVYTQFGTTAAAHVAYANRNAAALDSWLVANPAWRQKYAELDSQFRSLSEQLNASRRAP